MISVDDHRIQWRMRFVEFIVSKFQGSLEDKEILVDMALSAISQAHNEGVKDAEDVMRRLAEATEGETKRAYQIGQKALNELARRNSQEIA